MRTMPKGKNGPWRTCVWWAAPLFVLCTNVAPVHAQDATYRETQTGQDQNVIFKDDVLAAGGFGPNDVRLRVVPSPKRVVLLRPRVQFVPELLKSVESL